MVASIKNEFVEVLDLAGFVALFWGQERLVFAIKVVFYHVEGSSSKGKCLEDAFPEGEVETADLPLGVASEEVFRVLVTASDQRNPFFSLS